MEIRKITLIPLGRLHICLQIAIHAEPEPPAARLDSWTKAARTVHDLYFEPKCEEFKPWTIWSLSNAFTSAFQELDPIPQFKATANLGEFLEARFSKSF